MREVLAAAVSYYEHSWIMPIARSLFSYRFLYQFLCDTLAAYIKRSVGALFQFIALGVTGLLAVPYQVSGLPFLIHRCHKLAGRARAD